MSVRKNKELVRRYEEEVHNQGKLDVIDEIIAPSYTHHNLSSGGGSRTFNHEELKNLFKSIPDSIDNFHDDIHKMVAEGDLVVCWGTRSGTNKKNGNQGSLALFHVVRIEKGKIAELWFLWDTVAAQKFYGTYGKA